METNDPIPLFLSNPMKYRSRRGACNHGKERFSHRESLRQYFDCNGGDRFAILSPGNPLVLFENATLPVRHIGASGWHRSVDANIQSTADTQLCRRLQVSAEGRRNAAALKNWILYGCRVDLAVQPPP